MGEQTYSCYLYGWLLIGHIRPHIYHNSGNIAFRLESTSGLSGWLEISQGHFFFLFLVKCLFIWMWHLSALQDWSSGHLKIVLWQSIVVLVWSVLYYLQHWSCRIKGVAPAPVIVIHRNGNVSNLVLAFQPCILCVYCGALQWSFSWHTPITMFLLKLRFLLFICKPIGYRLRRQMWKKCTLWLV